MVPSDETLLSHYRQGDPGAFRTLVQRYTCPIYGLALRLLRDPMEAENVTQETFLRVVTCLDRIRLDLPFKPYLFQIAVNLCRDWARKKHPLLFCELDANSASQDEGIEAEGVSESIVDEAPPLVDALELQEVQARLHTALESLSPVYQVVITLRYLQDMTYEEIAQTLGLPLNTVRTQLRRAKQQLKIKMEKEPHSVHPQDGFGQLASAKGSLP
jgi:RNA polymerase sigma-70 factor, ECF subfamily